MKIIILSRDAKLYSTRRLVEAAEHKGHHVSVIDHGQCSFLNEKGVSFVFYKGHLLKEVDAVIPRIGASITFFGSAVVRQFEMNKVFIVNGSQAIVRSRDKLRSTQLLSRAGVGVPKTAFAKFPKDKDVDALLLQIGGAPVVIKLLEGTQGLGVVLAETNNAAKSVIEAFSGLKTNILIQEFVKEAAGADIRAFVVGNKVVAAMKRQGKDGEFRSNVHRGGKGNMIKLKKSESAIAVKAARVLGLQVAGIDILQSKRGPLVLEVNSSPGLQGIEAATGVNIADKFIEFIEQNVHKKILHTDRIRE